MYLGLNSLMASYMAYRVDFKAIIDTPLMCEVGKGVDG
jgi:hypothetical protein